MDATDETRPPYLLARRRWVPALVVVLTAVGAAMLLGACGPAEPCNGHAELCERAYDDVVYATTHNAMSNRAENFGGPNQEITVTGQLSSGVRALMLDTHLDDGVPHLCHASCRFGKKPLVDGLGEIAAFLDANPGQVVTIIFESYISHEQTATAFFDAGLADRVATHEPGEPWPTLGELIDADTPLVVFQDRSTQQQYPWLMNIWDHAWETHYSALEPSDLSCDPNRGNTGNQLFILNHFLTDIFGKPELAEQVNYNPFLLDRAHECQALSGALPNFVAVDFSTIGDVHRTVDALNGFPPEG